MTGRLCVFEGCGRGATYGIVGGQPTACSAHKDDEMVDLKHKLCEHEGCKRHPYYGEVCACVCVLLSLPG